MPQGKQLPIEHLAGESPRELIETKAREDIRGYLALRGKSNIYQATRNLSQNVSDDYGNRFLVELIQNAHDAHLPDTREGEIVVRFIPDEAEFGCLYVANRGNGFSTGNFEGITNIAMTSKPVNEGIGNKGLGFRSVLQICQWPEIYSALGSGGRGVFDGYCFRFATTDDIAKLINDQPDAPTLAEEIQNKMPFWYLPVYVTDHPEQVAEFAQMGFATVVRMPLSSANARKAVQEQLEELVSRKHPLHLFLDRVQRIQIEAAPGEVKLLTRKLWKQWTLESGMTIKRFAVGDDEYLLAEGVLPEKMFRETLEQSIACGDVPASWREWQGEAKVCVAVRLGRSVENGLLYCFLPLGKGGTAPLAGYINANFYTKMDRTSVNDRIGLNHFFMEKALEISSSTIGFLIERNWAESPGAVADLLCWQAPYDEKLRRMLSSGGPLLQRCLLPTRGADGYVRWSKVYDTHRWVANADAILSASALTRVADAAILLDGLSESQLEGVMDFFKGAGHRFKPEPSLVAEWIELIAQDLLNSHISPEKWADFYDEVATHMVNAGEKLSGRKFLLSVSRELIAAEIVESASGRRRAADVYFSPVMTLDADVDDEETRRQLPLEQFPTSLQQGFVFLSRELPWTLEGGGYRQSRGFLLGIGLVREYSTSDVIRTLARITKGEHSESLKLQALEWAFRLCTSGRSLGEKEIRSAGLFIPTRGGWCSAESAMFGAGWTACANGKKLEVLIKTATEYSSEMRDVALRVMPEFNEWGIEFGSEEDWFRFLHHAGVREHLRPIMSADSIQKDGRPRDLASLLTNEPIGLQETSKKLFFNELQRKSAALYYKTVSYRCELSPWVMPGLCESDKFEEKIRIGYAVQVLLATSGLSKESLQFRVYRPGNPASGPDQQWWPTPLAVLLREFPWMPVVRGNDVVRFVKPREAWEFDTDDDAVPPRFMELVASPVQRVIQVDVRKNIRTLTELRTLNDPLYAAGALEVFAETASKGLFEPRDVRRFRELFGNAWNCAAPANNGIRLNQIPVGVGEHIGSVTCGIHEEETQPIAYFVDVDDSAKQKLLEELQLPVFDFCNPSAREDSWAWLEELARGRFTRLTDVKLDVLVNEGDFDEIAHAPLLIEELGAWVADFIVCVAAHKGGKFLQVTQNTLGNIRRAAHSLRVLAARQVQISMAGKVVDLPISLHGALVVWRNQQVVLVIETKDGGLGIDALAHVAEQLAVALGYAGMASPLEAAFLQLLRAPEEADGGVAPSDQTVADALGVSLMKIREIRQYARNDLSRLIPFARLLALCKDLTEANIRLTELGSGDVPAEEEVRVAISPISDALGVSIDNLLDRLGDLFDAGDLMRDFNLPLAKLNDAIGRVDEFKPISNEKLHRRALDGYLSQCHDFIVERVRNAFLEIFDRGDSLATYIMLRAAVSSIPPNPDWFMQLDTLSDELLEQHVSDWFTTQGMPQGHVKPSCPSLKDCRDKNKERLRNFWTLYGPIVAAWVRQPTSKGTTLMRDAWHDLSQKRHEYVQRAHDDGWLDFRYLDDAFIAQQLVTYGIWPPGQPVSTEIADWGISEAAIQQRQAEVESARESARRKRLQITLDGTEFSAGADDYKRLAEAVAGNLNVVEALKDTNAAFRTLEDFVAPLSGSSQGGGVADSGRRGTDAALSEEQKLAIGLLGELYAKEWIKRFHRIKHGIEISDPCWVSGYRNILLGDNGGNEFLGYDFLVKLKGGTCYYYEVKASQGDSGVFEMGPTEISAAHRYRADGDNKYRILYVSHILDRKHLDINVLPNPFSRDGSKKLRAVGRGSVKFEFNFCRI